MSLSRHRLAPWTRCGIGLRAAHVAEVAATHPVIPWVEVHAENYMAGGRGIRDLEAIRAERPVNLHGVGHSLGGAERPAPAHLGRLRALAARIEPCLISEHLAWSAHGGVYLNDLLPIPYTDEALTLVTRNVMLAQESLGRVIPIENPSTYLRFVDSPIPEAEFLAELVRRTGCGVLCDLNNLYVNCANHGGDAVAWLDALPREAVAEFHLAGHTANDCDGIPMLIDDHGSHVTDGVWSLYRCATLRFPTAPALIEWDSRLPALSVLMAEAKQADLQRAIAFGSYSRAAA